MENHLQTYDHRYWLYERFLAGRRKNPKWSLRAYARQLGIAPSALSEILNNKRQISRKMAGKIAKKLGLNAHQTQLFVRSAMVSHLQAALPDDATIAQIQGQQFQTIDLETFKLISEWQHLAILCLAEMKCSAKPAWIAKKLGISLHQAETAIHRLKRLKFLRARDGHLVSTTRPLSILTQGYEAAIREFISQHLELAEKSLLTDPAELREINSMTIAIDPENLSKARDAITRFRRELGELLERGRKQRVYSLSIQLYPLDKDTLC